MSTAEFSASRELPGSAGLDPFARMLALGSRYEGQVLRGAAAVALLLHLAFGGAALLSPHEVGEFAESVREATAIRLQAMVEIETEPLPEPEPQPPEPEPEPVAPPPEPVAATEPAPPAAEAAAPAAAEAAAIVTAPDDEPLDLTDQGFVTGNATRFPGGATAANGTSTTAVRNPGATSGGTPGGTGTAPSGPPVVSKARAAGLTAGADWRSCPFPPEAEGENSAVVRLVVVVGSDGRPKSATVVEDPGFGFGRSAKRCAMEKMYEPPLDASGHPTAGPTPPFRVRFTR